MIFDVYAGNLYCGQLYSATAEFYSVWGVRHFSGRIVSFKKLKLVRVK